MRKLTIAEFISLDGVVESPERWNFPYVNDELYAAMWGAAAEVDTMLLGRVTFQSYAGAFANAPADDPIAAQMNRPTKVVVSSTLDEPGWANSVVLRGDVVEQVTRLKAESGDGIMVTGSITLSRTLLAAGLVDELNLLVHPIVVGKGRRLFADDGPRLPLELASYQVFRTGVSNAIYRPAA
jgi:dihydrofolate reductase